MGDDKLIINDKEVGLYYCLGAAKEIGEVSGGLEHLGDWLTGPVEVTLPRAAQVILILNHWYVTLARSKGIEVEPVTADDLMVGMDPNKGNDYLAWIQQALTEGTKKTVKVKPVPQKKIKGGRKASS